MVDIPLATTGISKGDLVEMAIEECGRAGYVFQNTPEEMASTIRKLDAMMAEPLWNQLGYNLIFGSPSQPSDLSGIPDQSITAVVGELAARISAREGVERNSDSKLTGARTRINAFAEVAAIPCMHSGYRRRWPFPGGF